MTDLTPYDIHRLDQAVPDAFADVDRLAADPETLDRLTQRGPAVYGAELAIDLYATCGGDAITLAGWAALATLRLVQANERLHDLNAEVGPLRAKLNVARKEVDRLADALTAELAETRAALDHANRELAGTRADLDSAIQANTAWANQTGQQPQVWAAPAEPTDVTAVRDRNGQLWVCPGRPGNNLWWRDVCGRGVGYEWHQLLQVGPLTPATAGVTA